MNYYRRFPGDYASATPHLSLAEHGAYTLLLDAYYSREGPLPVSLDLFRLCRAVTAAEKRAVQRVADEFFPVDGDVRRNQRADREIALAQPKIAAARENGKLGGRRKKTQQETGSDTDRVTHPQSSPSTNPQPLSASSHPRDARADIDSDGKANLPPRWWESESGMKAAARALGLEKPDGRQGESLEGFRSRINAALEGAQR